MVDDFFLIIYFLKMTIFRLMFFGHLPSNAYNALNGVSRSEGFLEVFVSVTSTFK